ncbi:MAG: FHA domain-containing protein [Chloroflexota bacterium]
MATQFQLVMRAGPNPGTTFGIEGEQMTIGRDSTNTIVINDAEVSRRHARLTLQGGKYLIEDLGSTNGTFVNNIRLSGPHVLKSGELISLGEQITLVFEVLSFDPNATMMSQPPRPTMMGAQPVSRPTPSQPSQPYAGQVPNGPASEPLPAAKSNTRLVLILVLAAVVFFICACIAFFLWVDSDPTGARWCTVMPFLAGCP